MLNFLKDFASTLLGERAPEEEVLQDEAERRDSYRFPMEGHMASVRQGDAKSEMRLKNLSMGGASGLTQLPVAVGEILLVDLPEDMRRRAIVRWVSGTAVGVKFVTPLDLTYLLRLYSGPWTPARLLSLCRGAGPMTLHATANEN